MHDKPLRRLHPEVGSQEVNPRLTPAGQIRRRLGFWQEPVMKNIHGTTTAAVLAVAVIGLAVSGIVAHGQSAANSQTQRAAAKRNDIPRLPDGHPDMQGVWNFGSATPLQRPPQFANKPVLTDAEAEAFVKSLPKDGCRLVKCDGSDRGKLESAYDEAWWDLGSKMADNRTSLIVDPPDGHIPPLTAEAEKKLAEAATRRTRVQNSIEGPEEASVTDRCILGFNSGPPMNPSAYNNMVQITQSRDYVVLFNEMVHNSRIVLLGNRPHLPSSVRQWAGDSRGHWEGDTFVVETTNFRADSIPGPGGGTSTDPMNTKLVERFTRTNATTIQYEYTISDPHTWTRPWTARMPMTKSAEEVYEYACHEGNYSMPNRLSGARALDRKSAGPTK
jgi:hypothetical protein